MTASTLNTRERLICAAEKLFGEYGVNGVSLREIAAMAGNRNNNAVQYHFQTKEGIVHAISQYRVIQMESVRNEMIEKAFQQGREKDLKTLLEILLLPLVSITDEDGKHRYAGFMQQFMTRLQLMGVPHAHPGHMSDSSAIHRTLKLLDERLSYLPQTIAKQRLSLCYLMFVNMLVRHDSDPHAKTGAEFHAMIEDTLECAVAMLSTPVRFSPAEPPPFTRSPDLKRRHDKK